MQNPEFWCTFSENYLLTLLTFIRKFSALSALGGPMPKDVGALPSLPRRLSPALPLLSRPSQARTQDFFWGSHQAPKTRESRRRGVRGGDITSPLKNFCIVNMKMVHFDGVVVKICLPISIGRVRFLCLGLTPLSSLPSLPIPPSPSLSSLIWRALASLKKFLELQMLVSEFSLISIPKSPDFVPGVSCKRTMKITPQIW
jgi:hypothetical protein